MRITVSVPLVKNIAKNYIMSTWITIEHKDDVEYDDGEDTIDVCIGSDKFGNNYVSIPVEFIKEILNETES